MHQHQHGSRLLDVQAILCGSVDREGLIHITEKNAESVKSLAESSIKMERAIGDLAIKTQSAIDSLANKTEIAISGLASKIESAVEISETQAERLKALESQKNNALGWLAKAAVQAIITALALGVMWWTYLHSLPPAPPTHLNP